jgi:hypothetical protein
MNDFPNEVFSQSNNICTKEYKKKYMLKSDDFISSNFKFKSGVLARITANLGCAFKHQHILKIYGSKKTFIYDDLGPRIYSGNDKKFKCIKLKMQSLPRNKTNILKNLILAIYHDHYNLNYTLNDFRTTTALCYAILSYKKLKKMKINYTI